MYISHMGDVRAVAGWYDVLEDKWRCDVLTNDHRGDDPVEAARYAFSYLLVARNDLKLE